jgi:DNA polymerase-4
LIQVPARPERYTEVSIAIMEALQDITPDVEIFSVDEAFLDVTRCQRYWNKSPETIGRMIKQRVWEVSGLPCSVGISGDKTTAKYAAKLVKPDGLVVIPPWEARQRLSNLW